MITGTLFQKKSLEDTPFMCRTCHPEDLDYAALRRRTIWFPSRELTTTSSASPGNSEPEINQEHVDNALRLLGVLSGGFGRQRLPYRGVGYLVPESSGNVIVTVLGNPVDQLTQDAARRVLTKISEPTPVKINVLLPRRADPTIDRPVIKVSKSNKTRDLPGAWL